MELAILEYVHWFNHDRLHESLGDIPPVEFEADHHSRSLSAAATCRLQSRSLFTYLSELLIAHNRGDPFPALA
jgi:hypothetical protein